MHPAARHEHMVSPSGRCSAPLGARLLPLEAKGFRRRGRAPTQAPHGKLHQSPPRFVRVSVRPLAGLVRRRPGRGARDDGRQVLGSRDASPRTRRGATVGRGRRFAGAAVRDVGGARAARAADLAGSDRLCVFRRVAAFAMRWKTRGHGRPWAGTADRGVSRPLSAVPAQASRERRTDNKYIRFSVLSARLLRERRAHDVVALVSVPLGAGPSRDHLPAVRDRVRLVVAPVVHARLHVHADAVGAVNGEEEREHSRAVVGEP